MKLKNGLLVLAAAAGAYAVLNQKRSRVDLYGKVVLITGASRGLGLATAQEFSARGSKIAICARDGEELNRAKLQLDAAGATSYAFVCDVSDPVAVRQLVASVQQHLGPVDVLVNNAANIKVGPFLDMTTADFQEAIDVIYLGALNTIMAVLPSMRERKQGSIVNITSVGGKVSIPHLLPYCCAKFALVALSEGLRAELKNEGISVSTIVPGLLRTGSHLNSEFKGNHAGEYKWFASGSATPILSISATQAAKRIVDSTVYGVSETVLSSPAQLLAWMQGVSPQLTTEVLTFANKFLPHFTGNSTAKLGKELEEAIDSKLWKAATSSGRQAAQALNQM